MTGPARGGRCCPVVELRQYTLEHGRREDLIDVFDGNLVEPQEALGMTVIGQFRDRRRPDRFVWLRGFRDMEGFGAEYSNYYKKVEIDKQADFVVRLRRAYGMALKIERRDEDAQLFVSWPPAEAQPIQVALMKAKRGTPGDNIVME